MANVPHLDDTIDRMKREIRADVANETVPASVPSFGDLNDYVDANCYGGLCEDEMFDSLIDHFGGRDIHEGMPQGMFDYINDAQTAIDKWIKQGNLTNTKGI